MSLFLIIQQQSKGFVEDYHEKFNLIDIFLLPNILNELVH